MKKLLLLTTCALAIGFTSCSKDDDGGADNCTSCSTGPVSLDFCDNGDGTYTINGEKSDIPEGVTYDELVKTSCAAIGA